MNSHEIFASRWKTVIYLAGSLIFLIIGLMTLHSPDRGTEKLWFCLVFFGVCAASFAWLLIRPQHLLLDDQGFTVLGGFVWSPKKVYWHEIDEFFVYRLPRGHKMIGYNFKQGAMRVMSTVRLARQFGADGALPKGWPQSPESMVEKLNAYRLGAASKGGVTAPPSA
ncbi:MAG: STM3941 family protein [Terracidiphilus sp.]